MNLHNAFRWQTVKNTVDQRLLDDSLLHTLESTKKIKKLTKLINKKIRKCRNVNSYRHYVRIKKEVDEECNNNVEETEDEEETLGYEEYRKIHDAKPKNEIRKFLKLCKKPVKRPPQRIEKIVSKKSPVKRTNPKKEISETKTTPKPSPSIKKRRSSRGKIGSQAPQNRSQFNVRRVDDEDEKLKVKKIVDDLIATDSVDSSPESVSKKAELSNERLKVSNDYEADVTASRSLDNTEGCSQSVEDDSITIDEILDLGEVLDDDRFSTASENQSPSEESNVLIPEATECDEGLIILPDDLSEMEKNVLKLNGLLKNVTFDKESNTSWLDLRHERHMNEDVVSESSLDSDASREITSSNQIINSQTEDEPIVQNAASNNQSKVKIRTIERFENGCNILSNYRSPNRIDKTFDDKLTSDIIDSSRSRKSSELSDAELKPEEETDKRSESSEVQSRHRYLSTNSDLSSKSYDEDIKNSVKIQLLSEIDQRLADSPSSKKRRSLDSESSRLSQPRALFNTADIDELFDNEVIEQEREVDAPRKRRISNKTTAEPSMLDALHSRKQGRYQNKIIRDLGWLPEEPNSPEAQSSKNKDDERPRKKRPEKLEEFVEDEDLTRDTTKSYFRFKDIDEDEEIWIMDVPKTINPEDLENRVLLLGDKSELTIGNYCYKVSSKPSSGDSNVSCVFAKSRRKREYEIVNIESKGRIKFRQKLSDVPDTEMIASKISSVPFPKNLKTRHPLFGASYKDKI